VSAAPSADGTFRVITPRTCGGFAESGTHTAGPLRFELLEVGRNGDSSALRSGTVAPATIWASSLDGKPIATSSRILVAHLTDAANTGAVFDGPEARSWLEQGTTPALVRRGRADVTLAFNGGAGEMPPSFAVFRLSPIGRRVAEVKSIWHQDSGRLSFTADTGHDPKSATLFYEIVRRTQSE
jgi:hypothetical protein